VDGRYLEHRSELGLCLLVPPQAEVRNAEHLANRRLVGLAALRLLERNRRLGGAPFTKPPAPLLEVVVDLAHPSPIDCRYGKFSTIKSSGNVKSRVRPISTPRRSAPAARARRNASASS